MPTAYIHMTPSPALKPNYCALLCEQVTRAIAEGLGRPAKLVHTYIVEEPADHVFGPQKGEAAISVQVFAHAGRTVEIKQMIGKDVFRTARDIGFPADNILYDFYDNPSGAIFVGGTVRWAKNDPRSNQTT